MADHASQNKRSLIQQVTASSQTAAQRIPRRYTRLHRHLITVIQVSNVLSSIQIVFQIHPQGFPKQHILPCWIFSAHYEKRKEEGSILKHDGILTQLCMFSKIAVDSYKIVSCALTP
jgi:hypothetical protein